jgi:hypothetical protein
MLVCVAYLWVEEELDRRSYWSVDVVGGIFQESIWADGDLNGPIAGASVDGGSEGSEAEESGRETHD